MAAPVSVRIAAAAVEVNISVSTRVSYPRALKLELPIGSGMIESGHRHVLQARLKNAGTAWLVKHTDQIANLRVLRANQRWHALWN